MNEDCEKCVYFMLTKATTVHMRAALQALDEWYIEKARR